jgi:hypothetical protein
MNLISSDVVILTKAEFQAYMEAQAIAGTALAAGDLKEVLEILHDFRKFVIDNTTQWKLGAAHTSPMWQTVATVLDKHGKNDENGYFEPGGHQKYYCG